MKYLVSQRRKKFLHKISKGIQYKHSLEGGWCPYCGAIYDYPGISNGGRGRWLGKSGKDNDLHKNQKMFFGLSYKTKELIKKENLLKRLKRLFDTDVIIRNIGPRKRNLLTRLYRLSYSYSRKTKKLKAGA